MLVGSGKPSMLFSPKGDYKNFRYRAEIKINDKGNSGMYVRVPKEATFSKGYEIQINSTHGDPVKTGSIYTYVEVYKQLVPPDTWFTQEVEVVNKEYRGKFLPHIKVWVNGELLYLFRDHTAFSNEGHFAFQQHDPAASCRSARSRCWNCRIRRSENLNERAAASLLHARRGRLPENERAALLVSSGNHRPGANSWVKATTTSPENRSNC